MRNGNFINENLESNWLKRPYPTYEEWKRENFYTFVLGSISPYPTYEEWKPPSIKRSISSFLVSLSYL